MKLCQQYIFILCINIIWRENMKIQEVIGGRIAEMRKKRGLTLKALAELSKGELTPSCVANWERAARTPGPNEAILLGRLLHVAPSYLLGLSNSEDGAISIQPLSDSSTLIPILNYKQAADPIHSIKMLQKERVDTTQYIPLAKTSINSQHNNYFALRIQDESMSPKLNSTDIVIVNPNEKPVPGGLVVTKIANQSDVVIRQYKQRGRINDFEAFELIPLNNNWANVIVDNPKTASIVGVVCQSIHHYT